MGGFTISNELYEDAPMPELEEQGYYPFQAITRRAADEDQAWSRPKRAESEYWEPYTEGGLSQEFVVYPLQLPDEPVVTAIRRILADSRKSTQRYNLMGQPVDNTYEGIVIHNGKLHLTPPHTQ